MTSTMINGFGAQPELPEYSVHLSTGNCSPPPTQSLEISGGRRKRGAHTNEYYSSTRHLPPKDVHCPSPRHDHSKRPKGLGGQGATKESPEYSHIPKSCCFVPIVAKYSSAGAALAKRALKTTATYQKVLPHHRREKIPLNRRSKGLQPTGSSIQPSRDLPVSRKT